MIIIQNIWKFLANYKDDPNDNITQSESFKYKIKITGKTPAGVNTKDIKIAVPLKYLSNFWRTLEVPLINCEVNLGKIGKIGKLGLKIVLFLLRLEKQTLKQLIQNFMFQL